MIKNGFIRSRNIKNINGLDIHFIETRVRKTKNNSIILLHGFPELSYSFRHLMYLLAKKGYYCVAPDQRGFGKTISKKKDTLSKFNVLNLTKDVYEFAKKINIVKFHLVGHDFGSYVCSYFAILYPNSLYSLTIMSMPFSGPITNKNLYKLDKLNKELNKLKPKKKHYQYYFSSKNANANIMNCEQGLKNFFRAYFHFKSYDYRLNKPFVLKSFSAKEVSKMPEYYIMKYNLGISQTVKNYMPSEKEIKNCSWLKNKDLEYYVKNFKIRGIKEPLKWYKAMLNNKENLKIIELKLPKSINIPSIFIAGEADWGIYQKPGELKKMETNFFSNYFGTKIIKEAGHWVQQEKPKETYNCIINLIKSIGS